MKTLYKKELSYYLNNPLGYITIIIFVLFANFLFVKDIFTVGSASMQPFFATVPWLLVLFVPALTMRIFAEEKRINTFEVLSSLPLSPWEIAGAKMMAILTLVGISLALTMGLPLSLSLLVSLYLPEIIVGYLGLILFALLIVGIGTYISLHTKNQIVAYLIPVVILFVLLSLSGDFFSSIMPKIVQDSLLYFAPLYHLENFVRGVIDIRSLVYFVSSSILFVYLTLLSLQKKP